MAPQWCLLRRSALRWCAVLLVLYTTMAVIKFTGSKFTMINLTHNHKIKFQATNEIPGNVCRSNMRVNALPPMPEDDKAMLRAFFAYLTQPGAAACRKVAKLGGLVIRAGSRLPATIGQLYVCLEPEFADVVADDCLVVSLSADRRTGEKLRRDAEAFGCRVLFLDPETAPFGGQGHARRQDRLEDMLRQRGRSGGRVQLLAVDEDGGEWGHLKMLLERPRESVLATTVGQLAVKMRFDRYLPMADHLDFYRTAYHTALHLQELGFFPFICDQDMAQMASIIVPGLPEKITSAMTVVWLKTRCV